MLTTDDDAISRVLFVKNSILDIFRIIIFIETAYKMHWEWVFPSEFQEALQTKKVRNNYGYKSSRVLIVLPGRCGIYFPSVEPSTFKDILADRNNKESWTPVPGSVYQKTLYLGPLNTWAILILS